MTQSQAPEHGWLILDKPVGLTSAKALGQLKKALRIKKCGHAGTLDSDASGILPVALGKATKTIPYVMEMDKDYEFTVTWGAQTTTDDARGTVIKTSEEYPILQDIEVILETFKGDILQRPPEFSALKIAGRRASDRKMAGEAITIKPRQVTIFALEVMRHAPDNTASTFRATVSKGTYIRALARDMGEKLGCFGHITALRRTRVGKFDLNNAKTLAKLIDLGHKGAVLNTLLLPTEWALDDILAITVNAEVCHQILNGQKLQLPELAGLDDGGTVQIHTDGKLVSLGIKSGLVYKPKQNFMPVATDEHKT